MIRKRFLIQIKEHEVDQILRECLPGFKWRVYTDAKGYEHKVARSHLILKALFKSFPPAVKLLSSPRKINYYAIKAGINLYKIDSGGYYYDQRGAVMLAMLPFITERKYLTDEGIKLADKAEEAAKKIEELEIAERERVEGEANKFDPAVDLLPCDRLTYKLLRKFEAIKAKWDALKEAYPNHAARGKAPQVVCFLGMKGKVPQLRKQINKAIKSHLLKIRWLLENMRQEVKDARASRRAASTTRKVSRNPRYSQAPVCDPPSPKTLGYEPCEGYNPNPKPLYLHDGKYFSFDPAAVETPEIILFIEDEDEMIPPRAKEQLMRKEEDFEPTPRCDKPISFRRGRRHAATAKIIDVQATEIEIIYSAMEQAPRTRKRGGALALR